MRRLFIIAFVIFGLLLSMGIAQETVYTNQITIAWDAVTTLSNGDPIPVLDAISYEVWLKKDGIETLAGETDILQYTITFNVEGVYVVGVRTKRLIAETNEINYSDINWSDIDGEATPIPFVVHFFRPANIPKNLRVQ